MIIDFLIDNWDKEIEEIFVYHQVVRRNQKGWEPLLYNEQVYWFHRGRRSEEPRNTSWQILFDIQVNIFVMHFICLHALQYVFGLVYRYVTYMFLKFFCNENF